MDDKKFNIDLKPLTDEDIKQGQFTLRDLWMVKLAGKDPVGPYHTHQLKEYAHKFQMMFEDAQVYNLEDDKWADMFKVSAFQRRKPQLVSVQNLMPGQDFYVLYNGQKEGPYGQDKIQLLLDKGHIHPSTQISLDKGKSWIKLYEHHAFDRRSKKSNQELPFKPTEDILAKVQKSKDKILKKQKSSNAAKDAIVELAYVGESSMKIQLEKKLKDKTLTKHNIPAVIKKSKRVKREQKKKQNFMAWRTAAISFSLLIAMAYIVNKQTQDTTEIKPIAEAPTQTRGIDNSERSIIKRAPAQVEESYESKQQKSLKKMQRFKKARAKRKVAPKKIERLESVQKRVRPKRFVKSQGMNETFERDIENIDINDAEIQDELTRLLAGEYEEEMEREGVNDYDSRDEEPVGYDDYDQAEQPEQLAPQDAYYDDEPQQYGDDYGTFDQEENFDRADY